MFADSPISCSPPIPTSVLEYGNVTHIRDTESISINRVDIWSESLAGLPTNHYLPESSLVTTENLHSVTT